MTSKFLFVITLVSMVVVQGHSYAQSLEEKIADKKVLIEGKNYRYEYQGQAGDRIIPERLTIRHKDGINLIDFDFSSIGINSHDIASVNKYISDWG